MYQYGANKTHKRFIPKVCNSSMTFEDCELAILRAAVDETEQAKGREVVKNEDVKRILSLVEDYIRRKKLILYGGTAVNNILPKHDQFYDRNVELPDYDFFSKNALRDAKELADIMYKEGFIEVEAKAGVHYGTFKVFVNFMPIADITQLNPIIYNELSQSVIKIDGLCYSPPNYLRMQMYLELSRPSGDVSRWEKVFKRLLLLNKHYPLNIDCAQIDFQRDLTYDSDVSEKIYLTTRDTFINQGVIFFGGYAVSLYSKYMSKSEQKVVKHIADFDVLSEEPERCARILKERLMDEGIKGVKLTKHKAIGEIVPNAIEVSIGDNDVIAFIYHPIACHSYNKIHIDNKEIKIATIDTILTFYFAFIYTRQPYYNIQRLLCMAKFLFDVEQRNRLEQKGLLKRFSIDCYGKQPTMEEIRTEKSEKYKELMNKRGSTEYDMWFLKYSPSKKHEKPDKTVYAKNREKGERREKRERKTRKMQSKTNDYLV